MTIKAIETHYNGYRFRSRLEARWAVFFDAMNIKYQYELEGFEVTYSDGYESTTFRYLPDFYLPQSETWVEVKGVMSENDASTLEAILDYSSPIPGIEDSDDYVRFNHTVFNFARGLLILGDIPTVKWGLVFHPIITHRNGLLRRHVRFGWNGVQIQPEPAMNLVECITGESLDITPDPPKLFDPACIVVESKRTNSILMKAYQIARQARFEHSETPTPEQVREQARL